MPNGPAAPTMTCMRWLTRIALLLSLSVPAFAGEPSWRVAPPKAPVLEHLPAEPREWQTIDGVYARVHGPEHRSDLLLRVANHAAEALPRLAAELGVPIGDTVQIYVVSSMEEFRALQPGLPPSWADATAYPDLGAVFLRAPELRPGTDTPLEKVLDHELVHVLLGRVFWPADAPRWLQEGVAQVYAGEFGPDAAKVIDRGPLMSLTLLQNGFPRDAQQAQVAYALSADFVSWLSMEHGAGAVPTLIRSMARDHDIDRAVRAATGSDLDTVQQEWQARLQDGPPAWLHWLDDGRLVYGLGAIALVGGGYLRRKRFHARMAQREAEEAEEDRRRAQAAWHRVHGAWPGVAG